jgi:aminoglycoside phosphotransferase (APT) family kinase protein
LYRLNRSDGIDPLEPLVALGIDGITGVHPVSGGMDTLIWRVETVHGTYALRLFQPNQRDQYWREIRAMEIAGTLGVPVPRITAHGMWGDRPAILMEWCDGRTVLDEVLVHPERLEPLGESMGRLQARIHDMSVPQEYWEDHRTWLDMAGPDEAELKKQLRAGGLRDGHPLHLDFHPLNVLCVGPEATVVLDWANVTVGDPRADVARTRSILRLAAPPSTVSSPGFDSIRATFEGAWMDGYTRFAGPLLNMELFEIWAEIVFMRDMEQYIGRPDFWMEPSDFDRVRDQIAMLKTRAGLSQES